MAHPNKEEQTRLRRLYHRLGFNFDVEGCYRAEYRGRTLSLSEDYNQRERDLTTWHRLAATQERLMKKYPDLWVSVNEGIGGCDVYIWVKRGNLGVERDAESIRQGGTLFLDDPSLHHTLAAAQEQAALAKQDDWFFCQGHYRAEKREDGHWFHFAGQYCKQFGEEHPAARAAAAGERYD